MTAVSSVYAQRLLITLFLVSFGIYMFLATVTYTPFDPGWMHISSDTQQVSNASGVAGAWIADLLFGFLGWASLLIPLFLFIEAIQVWWPRSFLNRPFRYAAQFFIILATSTLLYLHWNLPADTLDNASGGIIGYEIGESLSRLLTMYGATFFLLIFWVVLVTFAFGIQWNKTWATLKAAPAYLQDLFYKNVSPNESDFDLTDPPKKTIATPITNTANSSIASTVASETDAQPQLATSPAIKANGYVSDETAERLFDDVLAKEQASNQPVFDDEDPEEFEKTIQKAHQLQKDSQRLVATGEVWRALQSNDLNHKQEIDALLRAADDEQESQRSPYDHLQQVVM